MIWGCTLKCLEGTDLGTFFFLKNEFSHLVKSGRNSSKLESLKPSVGSSDASVKPSGLAIELNIAQKCPDELKIFSTDKSAY